MHFGGTDLRNCVCQFAQWKIQYALKNMAVYTSQLRRRNHAMVRVLKGKCEKSTGQFCVAKVSRTKTKTKRET
jgi:hypothetical protein